MKRIGYVWEELIDEKNCNKAIIRAIANKRKTKFLKHIGLNYEEFGAKLRNTLIDGWEPDPIRQKTINEGTGRKVRQLGIPSLKDHFVHTAVALILENHLTKRFYFHSCGSLPKRGQTFAVKSVETHLRKSKPKYCALADVKQFYKSVKKDEVMKCLRRVFKDEKFLALNEQILEQMGDGLAIGFTVSHWYAQLVLSFIDADLKENGRNIYLVRFMDNYVLFSGRKRTLHKALNKLRLSLNQIGLSIKGDWQMFPVKTRMVLFLSYRFNHEKTILRKPLMFRMAKRFKTAKKQIDAHTARTVMSYRGILKHCDSYHFRQGYLYPNVSVDLCRRLISNADKKRLLLGTA